MLDLPKNIAIEGVFVKANITQIVLEKVQVS